MGFLDFFSSGSSSKSSARAPSKAEKAISENLAKQSKLSMPLFEQLLGQSRAQQGFNDSLFSQMQGQLGGFNSMLSPEQMGQMQAANALELFGLGGADQELLAQAMGLAGSLDNFGQLTPEQSARIQQATDLAVQLGLSDLGQFRDQGLQSIAQNSAARGLRPTDTPIFNQSSQFAQESNRQAEQLVRGLRQQQAQQMLEYPLKQQQMQHQLQMNQIGQASDLANRRAGFLANLQSEAQNNQLNFGRGLTQTGLGIAQGSSGANVLAPLVSQRQFQSGQIQNQNSPSPASILGGFLGGL